MCAKSSELGNILVVGARSPNFARKPKSGRTLTRHSALMIVYDLLMNFGKEVPMHGINNALVSVVIVRRIYAMQELNVSVSPTSFLRTTDQVRCYLNTRINFPAFSMYDKGYCRNGSCMPISCVASLGSCIVFAHSRACHCSRRSSVKVCSVIR